MSEEPDSLVSRYLRRIDEKIDRAREDIGDLRERMTAVKGRLVSVLQTQHAQSAAIARVQTRMDRVERRLDIAEETS